jgi:ABC-type nitrate/sulfonate/bicarbonate transport system permease component
MDFGRKVLSPLGILVLWELASRWSWVDPLIVPPPSVVFVELGQLIWSGALLVDLAASLRRIVIGFVIAVFISVLIGSLMARFRIFEDIFDPLVELIRPVSPLAIFPLALLWFGIGDASKVFLIALACSFPVVLNTYAGVRGIDLALIRVARSLGATPWEILSRVVLPGSLPQIFTGVRVAWGIALIVIIASEMIGGVAGLGYMVLTAQQTFRVERVFAGIIVIGVLGFLTDQCLRALRRWLLPWYQEVRD